MDPNQLLGRRIAEKYELRRVLGRGGMGTVFEAVHVSLGRRVAVKLLDPAHHRSTEVVERFRREARAASAVESDHVVQVFDVGEDDAIGLYIVMELLDGEDLEHRIARSGKLDVLEALTIALQSARALAKVHARDIVHRDLKPANIFLTTREDGSLCCKVLDFGVSKLIVRSTGDNASAKAITGAGGAVGTAQYMSPEQAQGLAAVDQRTDVWALGAVLYEMLAGKPPYEALPTYEQTIVQIVVRLPPRLETVAPHLQPALIEFVHRALAYSPEQRLASCAVFAQELTHVAIALGIPVASGTTRVQVTEYDDEELTAIDADGMAHAGTEPAMAAPVGGAPTTVTTDGVSVTTPSHDPATVEEDTPEAAFAIPKSRAPAWVAFVVAMAAVGAVVVFLMMRARSPRDTSPLPPAAASIAPTAATASAVASTAPDVDPSAGVALATAASSAPAPSASVSASASASATTRAPGIAPPLLAPVAPTASSPTRFGGVGIQDEY